MRRAPGAAALLWPDGRDLALVIGLGCVGYGVAELWSIAAAAATIGGMLIYVSLWHGRVRQRLATHPGPPGAPRRPTSPRVEPTSHGR